jgi:Rrf2 family cysteine metabolism transcriptional repressor
MVELGLRYGQGPVLLRQIASSQGLPADYLEQLMAPLRRAGLLTSVRGVRGGYFLARPPEKITAKEIVDALEGDFVASQPGPRQSGTAQSSAVSEFWQQVKATVDEALQSTTLADLCLRQKEKDKRFLPTYAI